MPVDKRTANYFRQVTGVAVYKVLTILAAFISIPLTIDYLGIERYGIWSTMLSILSWITLFDLGVGNGLRNKVAAALAERRNEEASYYISSAYIFIGSVLFVMAVIIMVASIAIPWQSVFNTTVVDERDLRIALQITVFFISINFLTSLVGSLFNAIQKTSISTFGHFLSSALQLVFVVILLETSSSSILKLSIAYGFSTLAVNLLLTFYFFRGRPKLVSLPPTFRPFVPPLLSLGLKFFVIQCSFLVIFLTDKMLITQLFGPTEIAGYDAVFKLFGIATLIHSVITGPLWSAYTEAHTRNDIAWLSKTVRHQIYYLAPISIVAILIALFYDVFLFLWVGDRFQVSSSLVISLMIFVIISSWCNVFAVFLNGVQLLKIPLIVAVVGMTLNIPFSIFFSNHLSMGSSAVVLGTCTALIPSAVFLPLRTYYYFFR